MSLPDQDTASKIVVANKRVYLGDRVIGKYETIDFLMVDPTTMQVTFVLDVSKYLERFLDD